MPTSRYFCTAVLALIATGSSAASNQGPAALVLAQAQSADTKAEIAKKAYDSDDAKPKENWFGCPPAKPEEGEKREPASQSCDPRAPHNSEDPNKAGESAMRTGNKQ